jgi:hypothetical protein
LLLLGERFDEGWVFGLDAMGWSLQAMRWEAGEGDRTVLGLSVWDITSQSATEHDPRVLLSLSKIDEPGGEKIPHEVLRLVLPGVF